MAYKSKFTGKQIDDYLDSINNKQDKLVDGSNIATINGQSLTEGGDLTIEGGAKVYELDVTDRGESGSITEEEWNILKDVDTLKIKSDIVSFLVHKTFPSIFLMSGEDVRLFSSLEITGFAGEENRPTFSAQTFVFKGPTQDPPLTYTVLATVTPTKTSQLENDSNFVTSDGLKTINGESILGSGDITISGGSSSGSGAYPERIYTDADGDLSGGESGGFIFEIDGLQPNVFHVFPECQNLSISLGPETNGVANEYLFQFTSGATATTLSLPSDLKWANDAPPTIEPNKIYQVSILKGLASVLEFDNTPKVATISFKIRNYECIAEEGMTWEQWVSSEYNTINCSFMGNNVQRMGEIIGTSNTKYVTKTDVITSDFVYQLILTT